MSKVTVKRMHRALNFAYLNKMEGVIVKPTNDKSSTVKTYIKTFSYDGLIIGISLTLNEGFIIGVKSQNSYSLRVVAEPFVQPIYEKEIPWIYEGFWVEVVEKFVHSIEKKMEEAAKELNKGSRLLSILSEQ